MSMHKKPLTNLEREGLIAHGFKRDIGKPSMLADVFRHGMAWAIEQTSKAMTTNHTDSREELLERFTEILREMENFAQPIGLRLRIKKALEDHAALAQSAKAEPVAIEAIALENCDEGYDSRYGQVLISTIDNVKTLYTTPQPQACKVPDGMKLVPIEPTEAMCNAVVKAYGAIGLSQYARGVYQAMLAAAPSDSGEVKP